MLKSKIGLIFIVSILSLGCASADKKNEKVKKENQKKISKNVEKFDSENSYDFRNLSWGISPQEVMKLEIDKDIFDIPDMNGIGFYEEILGINTLVLYQFENNKLVKGSYIASGKDITEESYNKIKDKLYKKYGEFKVVPKESSSGKIIEAKTGRTVVRYFTDFEYSNMNLEYFEINYYNRQNKSEESLEKIF